MKKLLMVLVLVAAFAVGLGIGFTPTDANAGNTKCWTSCENGVALECCRIGPIVNCRVLAGDC